MNVQCSTVMKLLFEIINSSAKSADDGKAVSDKGAALNEKIASDPLSDISLTSSPDGVLDNPVRLDTDEFDDLLRILQENSRKMIHGSAVIAGKTASFLSYRQN